MIEQKMDKFKSQNLADLATDELRRRIIRGEIELGNKITEREVSEILGIGRMPAREALMALEHEGLIVNNSDSRTVLKLSEKDVVGLYELRGMLEVLAVSQAALNTNPERSKRLEELLNNLRFGCERKDSSLTTPADMALHEEIWAQSNNKYLERCLRGIRGAVFMLVMRGSTHGTRNWSGLYQVHEAVVRSINAGNVEDAILYMKRSLADASQHSIMIERQMAME